MPKQTGAHFTSFFYFRYLAETLLQLATPKGQRDCGGGFAVLDTPAYPHRGLLLDTGRRFYPPGLLRSTVDAMAMFKVNLMFGFKFY